MGEYLLGKFVSDLRKSKDLSLRDFGKMCGISHTTIDVIEKGYDPRNGKPVNITNSTFEKLSKGLGVPVSTLVELSTGTTSSDQKGTTSNNLLIEEKEKTVTLEVDDLSETDLQFVKMIQQLTDQEKTLLLAVMRSLIDSRGQ